MDEKELIKNFKRYAVFFDYGYEGLSFPSKKDIFKNLEQSIKFAKSLENKENTDFFIMDLLTWTEVFRGVNTYWFCQECYEYKLSKIETYQSVCKSCERKEEKNG